MDLTELSKFSTIFKIAGVIFVLLAGLLIGGLNSGINEVVKMAAQLKPESDTWNIWVDLPIPIYLKFYFFNITNEDLASGERLKVEEIGPYVFFEDLNKVDIKTDEPTDTVEYRMTRHYYFQPNLSTGSYDDVVHFINIPFLSLAYMAHQMTDEEFILTSLDDMLSKKGENLTRFVTVRELLFEGMSIQTYLDLFNDPIVQAAAESIDKEINIPKGFADGKFGILKGKNGSDDGVWRIHTGIKNHETFGWVETHNNLQKLSTWKGDSCNRIRGTDGFVYPPFLTREKNVEIFAPALCRSIDLTYVEETWNSGIPCLRYEGFIDSFKYDGENECYCPLNDTSQCISGLFHISPCVEGAPLIVSRPHFLGLDSKYRSTIIGLRPDEEKHRSLFDKHAKSGATVKGIAKMQFNMELIPYENMPSFANAQRTLVPIAWLEEGGEMDDMTKSLLRTMEQTLAYSKIVQWIFLGIGLLLFAVGIKLSSIRKDAVSPVEDEIKYE